MAGERMTRSVFLKIFPVAAGLALFGKPLRVEASSPIQEVLSNQESIILEKQQAFIDAVFGTAEHSLLEAPLEGDNFSLLQEFFNSLPLNSRVAQGIGQTFRELIQCLKEKYSNTTVTTRGFTATVRSSHVDTRIVTMQNPLSSGLYLHFMITQVTQDPANDSQHTWTIYHFKEEGGDAVGEKIQVTGGICVHDLAGGRILSQNQEQHTPVYFCQALLPYTGEGGKATTDEEIIAIAQEWVSNRQQIFGCLPDFQNGEAFSDRLEMRLNSSNESGQEPYGEEVEKIYVIPSDGQGRIYLVVELHTPNPKVVWSNEIGGQNYPYSSIPSPYVFNPNGVGEPAQPHN